MLEIMVKPTYEQQSDEPVIQLVDFILKKAIAHSASDVHFESAEFGLRVRYRIDGSLYDQSVIEKKLMNQVLSRIKVVAHIDITERRIPQDGKFRIINGQESIDLRVSTFPSIYGEKIVVRILDRARNTIKLEQLGMHVGMLAKFKELLTRSHGFFLVAGPTGSGKTTTLYAALSVLNSPERNIITLEDPVEYNLNGITQGQINEEVGFTFQKGLRALLRQDPDIVMVGEMRDKETAQIAVEAALTGHLVLSTVHTNDAPSVIMRLMDMGIEPFLINAAVTGVLAQRLVRKICQHCKQSAAPTAEQEIILDRLGVICGTLYNGKGCDACLHLGYKGRVGIFELLVMDSDLRALIVQHPDFDFIYAQARAGGMQTLLEDGAQKLQQGVITLDELVRVVA